MAVTEGGIGRYPQVVMIQRMLMAVSQDNPVASAGVYKQIYYYYSLLVKTLLVFDFIYQNLV